MMSLNELRLGGPCEGKLLKKFYCCEYVIATECARLAQMNNLHVP